MEEALRPACTGADRVTAPCESVSVNTSARLHFGFLDPSGRGPRPFGSFGLAIDRPQTRLSLRRGDAFRVSGVDCERAEPYLRAIAASFGLATSYHLHLDEVIPAHAGLGSGTQLALAIGSAVAVLEGLALDLTGIAARKSGAVVCWGQGFRGQLGDGNQRPDASTPQAQFVPVSGVTQAISVGAGGSHSCATTSANTIFCWGANDRGQLGNPTAAATELSPVAVTGYP